MLPTGYLQWPYSTLAKNTRANRHLIRSKNKTNQDTMVNRQVLKIKKNNPQRDLSLGEITDSQKQVQIKRKILSRERDILIPHEKSNLRPSDSALHCCTTEPQRRYGELGPLRSSYMTRVLHATKISNVDSSLFLNRIRKIVNSELG